MAGLNKYQVANNGADDNLISQSSVISQAAVKFKEHKKSVIACVSVVIVLVVITIAAVAGYAITKMDLFTNTG